MEWGTQKVLRNVTIECGLPERQELNTSFLCNPLFKKKKKLTVRTQLFQVSLIRI